MSEVNDVDAVVMCEGCEAVYAADDLNTADHLDLTGTHWTYEFCDACMRAMKEEEKTLIDGISGSSLADNLDVKFNT